MTLDEWKARLEIASASGLAAGLVHVLAGAALDAEAAAKENARTRLRVRSGHLIRSIAAEVKGPDLMVLRAGESGGLRVPYAAAQEFGAVINGDPFLTIPAPDGPALTASGDARYPSARDVPGLVFVQTLSGQPLLVDQEGTVWYILRRRVVLEEKRYARDGMDEAVKQLPGPLVAALVLVVIGGR